MLFLSKDTMVTLGIQPISLLNTIALEREAMKSGRDQEDEAGVSDLLVRS
jgi:hypothetical protein